MATKKVVVTGGAGQIAYALLFRIASGAVFGSDQKLFLSVLDIPESMIALQGVAMELQDCAFPLLEGVKIGGSPEEIFADADLVFLVGAKPRGPKMERKDLLLDNADIFVRHGKALDAAANPGVTVLVVGNPCNTNCLIARHFARRIDPDRFFAMTRLDENRARGFLAAKAGVPVETVSPLPIFGNHSSTQVPDFSRCRIGSVPAQDPIERRWLETEFVAEVRGRGAEVIRARGKSSAASAASAAIDAAKDLLRPTKPGSFFSTGLYSDGNPYGVAPGIVFSFPCQTTREGKIEIVEGLDPDPFFEAQIRSTEAELLEEKRTIEHLLKD